VADMRRSPSSGAAMTQNERICNKPLVRLLEWVWFDFLPIRVRRLVITVVHLQLAIPQISTRRLKV
jgi:hypothetical protein